MELRKRCYNNRLKPNTNKTKTFPITLFESDHLLISTIYSIFLYRNLLLLHSQKSWVILLMNIHKPIRVIYDVSK